MRPLWTGPVSAYLRPWVVGALAWGGLSLILLDEYRNHGDSRYLTEIWFLLSLLWVEFPFAGIFSCLRQGRYQRLLPLLGIALLPPALLHFTFFFLLD